MKNDNSLRTIYDIAKIAGVSAATVSMVLNNKGRINQNTRKRILELVEKSDYVPNTVARQLRVKRTNTVGVIISHFHNPFFSSLFQGIDEVMGKNGWSFLVAENHDDIAQERRASRRMAAHGVDGLIVFPCSQHKTNLLNIKNSYRIPVVLIGNYFYKGPFSAVVAANREGAIQATERLLSLRRTPILHLAGPHQQSMCRDRKEGFLEALRPHVDPKHLDSFVLEMPDLSINAGYAGMESIFQSFPLPCSVFAANDEMAIGIYKFCREKKLRIPDDVALIGFSDISLLGDIGIPITSMRIPAEEMGRLAANMIYECIVANKLDCSEATIKLPVELIERGSSSL